MPRPLSDRNGTHCETWAHGARKRLENIPMSLRILKGQTARFGRLFAVLVEKNSELPRGHKDRKYKGR
eukprot:3229129-Pyramimonas_sp.AAC.1